MGVYPFPNLDGLPTAGDEGVRAGEPFSIIEGVEAGEDQSTAAVGERSGSDQTTGIVEVGESVDVDADGVGRERFGPNSSKPDLELHEARLDRPIREPKRDPVGSLSHSPSRTGS